MSRPPNKEPLAQIASKLFALMKNDVKSAIEKGRLLQRAFEQHEGKYTDWLESINWSETGAKRYRDIYSFSQTNPQIGGFKAFGKRVAFACGFFHAREGA